MKKTSLDMYEKQKNAHQPSVEFILNAIKLQVPL